MFFQYPSSVIGSENSGIEVVHGRRGNRSRSIGAQPSRSSGNHFMTGNAPGKIPRHGENARKTPGNSTETSGKAAGKGTGLTRIEDARRRGRTRTGARTGKEPGTNTGSCTGGKHNFTEANRHRTAARRPTDGRGGSRESKGGGARGWLAGRGSRRLTGGRQPVGDVRGEPVEEEGEGAREGLRLTGRQGESRWRRGQAWPARGRHEDADRAVEEVGLAVRATRGSGGR